MAKNYFIADDERALSRVYKELILWFKEKQYEIDSTETEGTYFIQAKKTGTIRTLLGTNLAFQVKIYLSKAPTVTHEFIVETSTGKWIANLAGAGVTAMFTGGFTVLTGIAGAGWALIIENEIISYIENNLKFQKVKKADEPLTEASSSIQPPASADYFANSSSARQKAIERVGQETQKLESALTNGILTEEEFKAKKSALEDRSDEYEVEFLIEEKIIKFQKAFSEGILDAEEYEAKIKYVEESVRDQVLKERHGKKKAEKIAKLKQALENGILTEYEYQAKVAEL